MQPRILIATASLTTALLVGAAAAAHARGFDHGSPLDPFDRLDRLASELALDDATRARIDTLADEARSRSLALRDDIRRERDRLRDLLAAAEPDLAKVLAQADTIAHLEGDAMKSRLRASVEIRGLLTPEQRAELVTRMRDLRAAFERRRDERLADVRSACSEEIAGACSGSADDPHELRRCLRSVEAPSADCAVILSERPFGRRGPGGHRGPPEP